MALSSNLLLVLVGTVALSLAVFAWRSRSSPGAIPLSGFMLAIGIWSYSHVLEHISSGELSLLFEKATWFGIIPVPFIWFVFVIEYTGREQFLTQRMLIALFTWPTILMILIWIPDTGAISLYAIVWQQLSNEQGIIFWFQLVIAYGLLGIGSGLLVMHALRSSRTVRNQSLVITLGITIALVASIIAAFELFGDAHLHALPVGFTLMAGCFLWATVRDGLIDITPIAERTVIQTLSAGVIAINRENQVTSINAAATDLLDIPEPHLGATIEDVFTSRPAICDVVRDHGFEENYQTIIAMDDRKLNIEIQPLHEARNRFVGRVVLLFDVTDQQHRQEQLERQNEQLEQFAEILSHDLRNPLGVAIGRVTLAREETNTEHLTAALRALRRIEDLIDDVLALVQTEQRSLETETIDVARVARDCWDTIPTKNAALDVESGTMIAADERHLKQLLENVIGNAIEHGGDDVTITIGETDGGFFVEDDGAGLPDQDQVTLFEPGFSTDYAGTGVGLMIVREIAELHEWNVKVAESTTGGARFEFVEKPTATIDE